MAALPTAASTTNTPPSPTQAQSLSETLLSQCHALLHELSTFQAYLAGLGRPHLVELRQFKAAVRAELKSLEKSCELANKAAEEDSEEDKSIPGGKDGEDSDEAEDSDRRLGVGERKVLHSLRSSNLPFYWMVWRVATTACKGLVGFNKRFYWQEAKKRRRLGGEYEAIEGEFEKLGLSNGAIGRREDEHDAAVSVSSKRNVIVDIVAEHGDEWVKVSTITPTRLLFELAKQGWEIDSDNEESDEEYRLQTYDSDDDDDDDDAIELVKLAADMKKAAAHTRVRYKHPRIRFILPKIIEGQTPHVDRVIREIRKSGVTVQCGTIPEDMPAPGAENPDVALLEATFESLLPSPYPHRTPTLNVDCTLLLALVSDLSHSRHIAHSEHHHRAITRQIELEAEKPLVPSELWPAMGDKSLVCTNEAAQRMQEIVDTIGTETEKARAQLLMGRTKEELKREDLISRFQKLSDYEVPVDWKLPIRVVEAHGEITRGFDNGQLPDVARKVASQLSDINTTTEPW
ncbi:predicted protein [Uncinocarpus reesii 1704]|uniref:DUF1308 domain-containing protein n=1 Tax=Uncinocarpus reesii (strain UAMH 1704) TaxID=336963 RepID=C4JV17_UNCRE|nr:uncharacterized protein UREG_04970 [Uncinocarpus reesii 1704]EEP80128.1 predicted protein [Uncinocarpus reesii 1704]